MQNTNILSKKIAILGSGIIGLTTAHRLTEIHHELNLQTPLDISIISDKFGVDTTSDGAGGLFRPDDRFIPGVPKELVKKWATESFKYFDKLLFGKDGGKAGIFQASGYQMFDDERIDPSYKDYVYQFRHLTEHELNQFPKKFKYGYFSTTIGIDTRIYMNYLVSILNSKGVHFKKQKITSQDNFLSEYPQYDIIFNCLGFGSIEFCNDKQMVPIRGQMIRVKAPWIKHFYYTDDNCYIIPNVNTICLGGTRQRDNFSLDFNQDDKEGILERCKQLCPSLESASIEWDWVGLRPHREPIRVEKEVVMCQKTKKEKIIIHNYGHGGNGIALSRGTCLDSVDLLFTQNNDNSLKSKL
ncbi:unnamed protein product [Brachionus calyciflorus]|uniref:FAD dependent oxidoreductase domain-containing protein n=1 Tax=Brachionus calyciflorus TaxID=104777 RepID=A0A814EDS7_9BILA|nr:unnamed protein product [Brachionus calyciflorus]